MLAGMADKSKTIGESQPFYDAWEKIRVSELVTIL
jgi:hypothetical protein